MTIVPATSLSRAEMSMLGNNVYPTVITDRKGARASRSPHIDGKAVAKPTALAACGTLFRQGAA